MTLLIIGLVMVSACSYVSYTMGYAYGNNKGKDQILKENLTRCECEEKRIEMMYQRELKASQNCTITVSEVKDIKMIEDTKMIEWKEGVTA